MSHIGLVSSRVNKKPARYEVKTVACELGLKYCKNSPKIGALVSLLYGSGILQHD